MALSVKIVEHNGTRFTGGLLCLSRAGAAWAGIHHSGKSVNTIATLTCNVCVCASLCVSV